MSEGLRIIHAIRSDAFAGVEQFVARLAIRQARDGHLVHVIGGSPARMQRMLEEERVTFSAAATTSETIRALRTAVARSDVVNTHMTAADVAAVLALAGRRTRPALVSTRHFTSRRGVGSGIPVDVLIAGRIDAEISISRAVAATIGRPSTVVHSGVDVAPDVELPRQRVVLMAQRLEVEKRTDLGVRAFAASGLADAGWVLEIAGEGSERERLETLARQAVGPHVRFLGFRSDVPALMQEAGMLLAPCTVEGLGLSVIEAMAVGLPVIAADAGGHTEILQGLDARALYRPDDPEDAGRSLRSLAEDTTAREALGAAGRARQRTSFSMDSQAAGTETVYRAAIASRRSR